MLRYALLLLVLVVSGCAGVSVTPTTPVASVDAQRLAEDGDHLGAARAWTDTANASRGAARDRAWANAADQYLLAGNAGAARTAFAESNRRRLEGRDAALHDFINATFLADAGRDTDALALLGAPRDSLPADLQPRWHTLRAQVLERTGRPFDAAADLAWLSTTQDRATRAQTLRRIDALLNPLDDGTLAQGAAALPPGHPLYNLAGRQLVRRGLPLPRPFDRDAAAPTLGDVPPAERDGYRPPLRLAVLLPLSGPLSAAGQSVRDGLLAGYYAETRRRPELKFYDTAGNAAGLQQALAKAREDGAQMLVGPLTRDEVNAVFNLAELDLPTIALNRGTVPPPSGSTTFALSPEEEGAAAADRLADRRLRRVLVVHQADEAAQRALGAFRERLRERGGEIIGEASVGDANPDYVPALTAAMRGQRPDALFLAMKAGPARLLSSQMENATLAGVPRVATSLILQGTNLRMDTELDGIEYPELPWLLGTRGGLPDPDTIGNTLPSAKGGGARLFAFGLDAWRLAAYLELLTSDPAARVPGATGELQVDALGNVQRIPAWAVFSGGRARPALDGALLPDAPSAAPVR